MNGERAQAYGEAIKTLDDLPGSQLHAHERDVVREAADALFFCEKLESDPAAEQALVEFYEPVDHLIESERLLLETAAWLTAAVEACGPLAPVIG